MRTTQGVWGAGREGELEIDQRSIAEGRRSHGVFAEDLSPLHIHAHRCARPSCTSARGACDLGQTPGQNRNIATQDRAIATLHALCLHPAPLLLAARVHPGGGAGDQQLGAPARMTHDLVKCEIRKGMKWV
jgi:hypothetical protein